MVVGVVAEILKTKNIFKRHESNYSENPKFFYSKDVEIFFIDINVLESLSGGGLKILLSKKPSKIFTVEKDI